MFIKTHEFATSFYNFGFRPFHVIMRGLTSSDLSGDNSQGALLTSRRAQQKSANKIAVLATKTNPTEIAFGGVLAFQITRNAYTPLASAANNKSATILVILIIGLTAGPAVSL